MFLIATGQVKSSNANALAASSDSSLGRRLFFGKFSACGSILITFGISSTSCCRAVLILTHGKLKPTVMTPVLPKLDHDNRRCLSSWVGSNLVNKTLTRRDTILLDSIRHSSERFDCGYLSRPLHNRVTASFNSLCRLPHASFNIYLMKPFVLCMHPNRLSHSASIFPSHLIAAQSHKDSFPATLLTCVSQFFRQGCALVNYCWDLVLAAYWWAI
jgi:hypothetical protein